MKVQFINFNPEAPARGYWDQTMLEKMFSDLELDISESLENFNEPYVNTAIIVIPASQNVDNVDKINKYISYYDAVLLILTGDEEGNFATEKLKHPKMKIWKMIPHVDRFYPNVDRFLGFGFTPHCLDLPKEPPKKTNRWFFAGQINQSRRVRLVKVLRELRDGELVETPAFAKGLSVDKYIEKMLSARVIPCAGAPVTPDTFRFYEALETGCVPLVDQQSARAPEKGYYQMIYGEDFPIPIINSFNELVDMINYYNDTFVESSNKMFAWWQMYKRNLKYALVDDFMELTKTSPIDDNKKMEITVVIPTSPTKSNPDTKVIEETIETVRAHLPKSEIIITFDGVRPEQQELVEQYNEFKRRVLWIINHKYTNVIPLIFDEHRHQVAMMREALKYIRTDKILYVEHDAPLTPDEPIDWYSVCYMLDSKQADLVRFHFEATIPEEHKYLMLDMDNPLKIADVRFLKTIQWSQRPHLATKEFYTRILRDHFTQDARTFIEDKMHGVVSSAYRREQMQGWNEYKLWIYYPEGNIKRSYHLDGRGTDKKFDMIF